MDDNHIIQGSRELFIDDGDRHCYAGQYRLKKGTGTRKYGAQKCRDRWGIDLRYIRVEWEKPLVIPTGVLPPFFSKEELAEIDKGKRLHRKRKERL